MVCFPVHNPKVGKDKVSFQTKLEQAVEMLVEIHSTFNARILCIANSWFGNDGLRAPARKQLGTNFHLLSRHHSNNNVLCLHELRDDQKKRGWPRKYGLPLGNASVLARKHHDQAQINEIDLYGRIREVRAFDRVIMLKTLKCSVQVVWVYRKRQWVALSCTDLSLSVQQIIEYYGARWKIESGFKELNQDIGSLESQCSMMAFRET